MANYKIVTLKDPTTGEYLIPRVPRSLAYDVLDDGSIQAPIDMDAGTLGGHPASDFLLKSEYTPTDLSAYLKTSDADNKYALKNHTHSEYALTTHNHDTSYIGKAIAITATFTTAGWQSQSDGSFKQTVTAAGLKATDDYRTATVLPVGNDNKDTQAATDAAYALVDRWICDTDNQLTARCPKEKPTTEFQVHIVIMR